MERAKPQCDNPSGMDADAVWASMPHAIRNALAQGVCGRAIKPQHPGDGRHQREDRRALGSDSPGMCSHLYRAGNKIRRSQREGLASSMLIMLRRSWAAKGHRANVYELNTPRFGVSDVASSDCKQLSPMSAEFPF